MPYLILAIGLALGLFALYRFFLSANIRQIKAAFLVTFLITVAIALLFLALTGKLPAALGLTAALIPIFMGALQRKQEQSTEHLQKTSEAINEKEALEILGLKHGVTSAEVKAAYKKLMQKVHPDNEGSDWMAAKLNEAKNFLLKKEPHR